MSSSHIMIASVATVIVALASSSLRIGEAFVVVVLISLALWRGYYIMSSWLGGAFLPG
jgi:hypothetical protein